MVAKAPQDLTDTSNPGTGSVPVPDPTTLTNNLVSAAVTSLRELLETRLDGMERLSDERMLVVDGKFAAFRDLHDLLEKATGDRFDLLKEQTIKAAADVKSAVDAAFAAAASGVAQQNQANFLASQKQEAAFTKTVDQLAASVAQISKASDDKLNDLKKTNDDKFSDLKDRIVAIESRTSGSRDSFAWMIAVVSAFAALALVGVDFLHK
jgi:hypothetical protein